jgi:hypothetical protein
MPWTGLATGTSNWSSLHHQGRQYLPPWDAQARQGTAAINDALSDLRHNAGTAKPHKELQPAKALFAIDLSL